MIYLALFVAFFVAMLLHEAITHTKAEVMNMPRERIFAALIVLPLIAVVFVWALATIVSTSFGVDWCAG